MLIWNLELLSTTPSNFAFYWYVCVRINFTFYSLAFVRSPFMNTYVPACPRMILSCSVIRLYRLYHTNPVSTNVHYIPLRWRTIKRPISMSNTRPVSFENYTHKMFSNSLQCWRLNLMRLIGFIYAVVFRLNKSYSNVVKKINKSLVYHV
jgi:hypothetical protein